MQFTQITKTSPLDFIFPSRFSFFEPYIKHHIREILELEGEAHTATNSKGEVLGIFMYDDFEKSGTIYTIEREAFDYFYRLKSFNFLFSELKTELRNEVYDIYTLNLVDLAISHKFSYEISAVEKGNLAEIERFILQTHPGLNKRWVRVALENGERCFLVKLSNELVGAGWVSLVNGVGRLHSLYVEPQYRRMEIGKDLLYARLLWLKANHAQSVFTEIARNNIASANNVMKAQMKPTAEIYHYYQEKKQNRSAEP
jgi:ribosomal protein S18 acetylase RimI-like enzyme